MSGIGRAEYPSFRQYFDTALFSQIRRDLNVNSQYDSKVVSVGMHPTVAELNKFYTLYAYTFNYSLDYKHKFRKMISKELNKEDALRSYFDDWGSRCYVFSAELFKEGNQFLCSKHDNLSVSHLEVNMSVLKELGCQYIFSAVDIKNYIKFVLYQ